MTTLTDATDDLRSLVASDGALADVVGAGSAALRLLAEGKDSATTTMHPLGFIQIKLGTFPEFSLRFHIWPIPRVTPQTPVWRVHRHGWLLRSYILCGGVINFEYKIETDPNGEHRLYGVDYSEDASMLRRTPNRISYAQESEDRYLSPAVYEVPPSAFHATVSLPNEPTATFVVVYTEKECSPLVVGAAEADDRYEFRRHQLSPLDLQQALSSLV